MEGQDFDTSKLGSVDKKVIKLVPKIGLLKMALRLKQQPATNGWLYFTEGVGNFGTDYVLRGMANLLGPGWNRPQNAVYPISQKDAEGNEYDGARYKYVMHFDKGGLVADHVRQGSLLRSQSHWPLRAESAQHLHHQPGRFGGLVHPGRIAGKRQRGQLAAGAARSIQTGYATVWAAEIIADHSRRQMDAAAGEAYRVIGALI